MTTREDYFTARSALQRLVEERESVFPQGIDALRGWLSGGFADRWCSLETVINAARREDLPQAMMWDFEWRQERKARAREERKAREQAARAQPTAVVPAPPATRSPSGSRPTASGPRKQKSNAPAPTSHRGPRAFEPRGPVWRP